MDKVVVPINDILWYIFNGSIDGGCYPVAIKLITIVLIYFSENLRKGTKIWYGYKKKKSVQKTLLNILDFLIKFV